MRRIDKWMMDRGEEEEEEEEKEEEEEEEENEEHEERGHQPVDHNRHYHQDETKGGHFLGRPTKATTAELQTVWFDLFPGTFVEQPQRLSAGGLEALGAIQSRRQRKDEEQLVTAQTLRLAKIPSRQQHANLCCILFAATAKIPAWAADMA
ncbi:hypothetical protein BD289DRAFT_505346 [Coniella lustricola]|uniref:Uncharacterized protein n=1 Tax=Coniella lustricola TaxID=2025994 RepID=A0A2T3AAK5_9PEZI|nr:hypothetical protein BD289DRAFT_505346 [Coniella lustricola]